MLMTIFRGGQNKSVFDFFTWTEKDHTTINASSAHCFKLGTENHRKMDLP